MDIIQNMPWLEMFWLVACWLSCHNWHMLPAVCWCILVQRKLHKHLSDNIYWIKFTCFVGFQVLYEFEERCSFGWLWMKFWRYFGCILDKFCFFLCVVNLKYCCDILDDTMMQNKKNISSVKEKQRLPFPEDHRIHVWYIYFSFTIQNQPFMQAKECHWHLDLLGKQKTSSQVTWPGFSFWKKRHP